MAEKIYVRPALMNDPNDKDKRLMVPRGPVERNSYFPPEGDWAERSLFIQRRISANELEIIAEDKINEVQTSVNKEAEKTTKPLVERPENPSEVIAQRAKDWRKPVVSGNDTLAGKA